MNITINNIDELNSVLKVQIDEKDYKGKYDSVIKDYRKKVNIHGFRPGMVPAGIIKKMYGKQILIEEVNKIISEEISKYITEKDLNIIGRPLPSIKEQKSVNWDKQDTYEFSFDIARKPEFEISLSKRDKIDYYVIIAEDKLVDNNINNYAKRFGAFIPVDKVKELEMLRGTYKQLDEKGNIADKGISVENAALSLDLIKDEKIKKKFKGVVKKDIIVFNPKDAFPNNIDLASMFGIGKDKVEVLDSDFQYQITDILEFKDSEINQDLFDKVLGEDVVNSEEEFRAKVKEGMQKQLSYESDYKFMMDAKDKLIKKYKFKLPDEFLKRWILLTNKDKITEEKIEEDYKNFENEFRWQLIKGRIIREQEISISDEELKKYVKGVALINFRNYGITDPREEQLEKYTEDIINNEEEKEKLLEKRYEIKVLDYIRETVKIENKEVSTEEFNKLLSADRK